MYEFSPDEIDRTRADYQAKQHESDKRVKRVGNLGELAFEQFCREYLPTEMWEWANEDAIRRCNEENYTSHDFRVFGYDIDVKTSRDVSAFRPQTLVEGDTDDDIIVMAWHRDKEDSLILIGWEFVRTLVSKVETQEEYSGDEPDKLRHIPTRPMNDLNDLGPNTAFLNQKPSNPFEPGDRVQKAGDSDASEAIVVEVLPPETQVELYGQEINGEAVRVAFPSSFDDTPMALENIPAALLASYCDDQDIRVYTYKHENLEFAESEDEPVESPPAN
ncbi:hypothetical protein HARCEL1_03915 [Halococcoides cellulosivorans]|uniref:Uncharacterized protein n=1 Tax=Halococcoides cellulosivorans TaxID=1679096 RepID=A0A2R4WZE5_9EURY|nr:hypothetical protein [Halococcoides cellulosivorans]AWB26916.1 hypothetical protein HARCEL1_03915 [Halococcoides cellulosivorans]